MKNFKRFAAFVLTLCIVFSLGITAFAAEIDLASGAIPNSNIKWSLDEKGWLTLSGSGGCATFESKDDQPWADVREQITQVWFDDVSQMKITDLAYWFEGCVNLTHVELPLAPSIGKHAFYNCPKLNTITMYYGEVVLNSIGEDAFWREVDLGDTLTVYYILGYPEATVPFYSYDWAASNRASRQFEDVYGIADLASVVGNCPSCGQYSLQATYVSTTHTSRGHQEYSECYKCHYVVNHGTYVYKDHGDGSYGSWTCPSCGSHTWVLDYEQDATCTSNGYRSYSCACGQTKRETIYASGHSYRYGSCEQYSGSKHRRETYCRNCGDSDYEYANHSLSYGSWSEYSST